jgi:hypothetical protein
MPFCLFALNEAIRNVKQAAALLIDSKIGV